MSSSNELDPRDLALTDLELREGPRIDTSDEFPLPSLELGEECDVDVLFPPDGEPTEEERPVDDEPYKDFDEDSPWNEDSWRANSGPRNDRTPPVDATLPPLPPFEKVRRTFCEEDVYHEEEGKQAQPEPSRWDMPQTGSSPVDLPKPAPAPEITQPGVPTASLRASEETSPSPETTGEGTVQVPVLPGEESEEPLQKKPAEGDAPADNYVRKVRVKKGGVPGTSQVRPWVPAAGVAILMAGYLAAGPLSRPLEGEAPVTPVLVVASEPQGELFAGDVSLGTTPVALTPEQASQSLQIRKDGYRTMIVPEMGQFQENTPVQKFVAPLEPSPVALSWDGVPEGSKVWWNGTEVHPDTFIEALPGEYRIKVQPKDRPAVEMPVVVAPGRSSSIGNAVEIALAKQPHLSIGLTMPDAKTKAKTLSMTVKSLDSEQPFAGKLQVSGDKKAGITLPGPGKYKISFAGNDAFKAASETVELASGGSQEISLKLAKVPPKPKPKPVAPSHPSYRPSTPSYHPTYYPPPRYYPSGGGGSGGGGRIAPPSF